MLAIMSIWSNLEHIFKIYIYATFKLFSMNLKVAFKVLFIIVNPISFAFICFYREKKNPSKVRNTYWQDKYIA